MLTQCPEFDDRLALANCDPENWKGDDQKFQTHLLECDSCLRDHQALLLDRFTAQLVDEASVAAPTQEKPLSLGERFSVLLAPSLYAEFVAFRSSAPAVLYSGVIPTTESYVLMELSRIEQRLTLRLENAAKNAHPVEISLYKDSEIVEKSRLRQELEWRLDWLTPGQYALTFGDTKILSFLVQG